MKEKRPDRRQHRTPRREVAILYEDEALIAIDKPAGLPAVPVAKNAKTPSAWSVVASDLRESRARRERAFVVHRIDRFTSGVMLFAKTERDRDMLVRQFLEHTPVREYVAVVRGHLEPAEGTLVHYLRKEGQLQKLSSQRDKDAARAEMHYRVEQKLRDASLVRVDLVTGLQNQIRVQFSGIGHPVIGDRKYHPAEANERRIDRVALHAARLEFVHPRTRKKMAVDCAMPQDLIALLKSLTPRSRS
jgi:23S rRNA pseudouridine1911/1915/1917 synthase